MHANNIFHRDVKPDNFLLYGDDLQLNDFDLSCFRHEEPLRSFRPVGTCLYWSPRCDASMGSWMYDEVDDWMGLALTFAAWLGVYAGGQNPTDNIVVKMHIVEVLLLLQTAPMALKERIQPAYVSVRDELTALGLLG